MSNLSQTGLSMGSESLLAAVRTVSQSYGTFQGTPLEFSQYCTDQFEAELNLKGLLRKLVAMMSRWMGVDAAVFIASPWPERPLNKECEVITFHDLPKFSQDVLEAIDRNLRQGYLTSRLDSVGLVSLRISEGDFLVAKFAAPQGSSGFLVCRYDDIRRVTPGVLIDSKSVSNSEIMAFLIDCAQKSARWLQRLDSAQSLLYQDEVTGLFNFRYLDVALDSEFRRLQRFHTPFSLLFIDLDNFKQVNDIYGHMTGSSILRQVGAQIKAALRDVDVVIRYGGDEFVVVLIGTNSKQAVLAAERVRAHVNNFIFSADALSKAPINVSTSIGVASCPEHAKDKKTILKMADDTMYMAKRGGKNRVVMVQDHSSQHTLSPTLPRETSS